MISKSFKLIPFHSNELDLSVTAEVKVIEDYINFFFKLKGNLETIYINKNNEEMNRVIGLWANTCFEFFILNKNDGEYFEFNFGTDSSWNCFIFNSYRSELTEYSEIKIDNIIIENEDDSISLRCSFPLKVLGHSFEDLSNLKVSPTCILKAEDNITHYYSNKHPDSKPNFHHPESFVELIETN